MSLKGGHNIIRALFLQTLQHFIAARSVAINSLNKPIKIYIKKIILTIQDYLFALAAASLLSAQGEVGEPDTEMTRDTQEEVRAERERYSAAVPPEPDPARVRRDKSPPKNSIFSLKLIYLINDIEIR